MVYYDERNDLTGAVRDLAAKKLGASAEDRIEFAEWSWDSGFCETCSYTEYEFSLLLNGSEVYNSRKDGHDYFSSPFEGFQNWLTAE